MPSIIHHYGSSGKSFDEMVPQGPPLIEQLQTGQYVVRQTYLCRMRGYRRPVSNSPIPKEIAHWIKPVFFFEDSARTPTGIADVIIFQRSWLG